MIVRGTTTLINGCNNQNDGNNSDSNNSSNNNSNYNDEYENRYNNNDDDDSNNDTGSLIPGQNKKETMTYPRADAACFSKLFQGSRGFCSNIAEAHQSGAIKDLSPSFLHLSTLLAFRCKGRCPGSPSDVCF